MDAHLALNATLFTAASLHILLPLSPNAVRQLFDRVFVVLTETFKEWRLRARSRRELSRLDERQLRDIGLTISDASFESSKSFLQC
jgi:uncharacterized protein YjiS (DUF1127 family)